MQREACGKSFVLNFRCVAPAGRLSMRASGLAQFAPKVVGLGWCPWSGGRKLHRCILYLSPPSLVRCASLRFARPCGRACLCLAVACRLACLLARPPWSACSSGWPACWSGLCWPGCACRPRSHPSLPCISVLCYFEAVSNFLGSISLKRTRQTSYPCEVGRQPGTVSIFCLGLGHV